jgi:hypothetical protein
MRMNVNLRYKMILATVGLWLAACSSPSRADTVLLLSVEDGTNLHTLHVNDTFAVTVRLTSKDSDLSALGTSIAYNTTLLSEAFNLAPGAIIAPANFLGSGDSAGGTGTFDVFYTDPLGDPITATGIFFTFNAKALTPGSGTIGFAPASSYGFDLNNDPVTVSTGGALSFNVLADAPTSSTPTPTAVLGGLVLLGGMGAASRKQWRRPE